MYNPLLTKYYWPIIRPGDTVDSTSEFRLPITWTPPPQNHYHCLVLKLCCKQRIVFLQCIIVLQHGHRLHVRGFTCPTPQYRHRCPVIFQWFNNAPVTDQHTAWYNLLYGIYGMYIALMSETGKLYTLVILHCLFLRPHFSTIPICRVYNVVKVITFISFHRHKSHEFLIRYNKPQTQKT